MTCRARPINAARARQRRGFTLLELMIGLAVLAVLATLAVPSMGSALQRQRLRAAAEHLAADLNEARFEATRRGQILHVLPRSGPAWCWAVAREPGSRSKIAVTSHDDRVDAVGSCVGMKGSRVQAVTRELNGERIDIVPWSNDPERFAKLALAPAKVARVFSDATAKTIQAVVDEDQLSLAIGRNGQNVRLASELTGWKIDLYSSREWLERGGDIPLFAPLPDEEAADVPLSDIGGLETATVAVLEAGGYRTLNDIIDLDRDDLLKLPAEERIKRMRDPAFRAKMLAESPSPDLLKRLSQFRQYITTSWDRMFPMGSPPNYEPAPEESIGAMSAILASRVSAG